MNIKEVQSLIDPLIPKAYKFAYAIVPSAQKASELIADSYSVLLVKELNFIEATEFSKNKQTQKSLKRFFLCGLMREMLAMSSKKPLEISSCVAKVGYEFQAFYKLSVLHRSVLTLKDKLNFSEELISQVTGLKKHQVVECLYNGRELLNINDQEEVGLYE